MVNNTLEYQHKNKKKYRDNPDQRENRKIYMRNRRAKWLEWAGRDKEIDHIDNNPKNNAKSNLRVVSRVVNRRKGALKANGK